MKTITLGISAYFHDSAAALLVDGIVVAAAEEERFTRVKHDASFPLQAISFLLQYNNVPAQAVDTVVFYEKPLLKLERILDMAHATAPYGWPQFSAAMRSWMHDKLFFKAAIRKSLATLGIKPKQLLFSSHHLSHAASAFFPSPFEEATILTVDGVGEWSTATIGHGNGSQLSVYKELRFPQSVGMLYSAFTYYLGFTVNSGEYKVMGLAPYGDPVAATRYMMIMRRQLVDIKEDGSIAFDLSKFRFHTGLVMTNDKRWHQMFNVPRRMPESALDQQHADLALAVQKITEDILLRMAAHAKSITKSSRMVMAGGVALNCVANAALRDAGIVDDIWVQPAASDAGGAIGACLAHWHIGLQQPRVEQPFTCYLGPSYSAQQIKGALDALGAAYVLYDNAAALFDEVAEALDSGQLVGWFQGRMEFGPRALGNRSILADARKPGIKQRINASIKQRETFRPFAPVVLEEDAHLYFDLHQPSPYMLFTAPVLPHLLGSLPAITHEDGSARVQTVRRDQNSRLWELLCSFRSLTQCSVLLNTSFNVRGEPIVNTPAEAYKTFRASGLDMLVMGNFVLRRTDQPALPNEVLQTWNAFALD